MFCKLRCFPVIFYYCGQLRGFASLACSWKTFEGPSCRLWVMDVLAQESRKIEDESWRKAVRTNDPAEGSLKRRRNFPLLLSRRCHLSFFSSCCLLRSPLICRILPSSTSTLTSSFFSPGRSTLKTCASGVSFQSTLVAANCDVSRAELGALARADVRKPSNGSQVSRENGSKTLDLWPLKKLGMSDIFWRMV